MDPLRQEELPRPSHQKINSFTPPTMGSTGLYITSSEDPTQRTVCEGTNYDDASSLYTSVLTPITGSTGVYSTFCEDIKYDDTSSTRYTTPDVAIGPCHCCCQQRTLQTKDLSSKRTVIQKSTLCSSRTLRNVQCYSAYLSALVIVIIALIVPVSVAHGASSFTRDFLPRSVVYQDSLESQSFPGNSSHKDHFRLLQRDGDSLIIGARNIVYNISIQTLKEDYSQRLTWNSQYQDSTTCFNKGKSEEQCQNYIRVLAEKEDGVFLVCGTNAFKPLCREYTQLEDGSFSYTETNGVGKCPFDPLHNSTYVFTDGDLYSGTVADFQGITPLIIKDNLKTDPNDYKELNAPDFVHSFEYGDHVFFMFRETAVEYMNCGKRVYSRVARVCKKDRGGASSRFRNSWTSFLKSRINCSVPGDFPFYFDEIQSSSSVISGTYGEKQDEILYAVFTTPYNSIPGSAVCAFSMRSILDTFEGDFKEQEGQDSNWLPVHRREVPEPRPGMCVNNSQSLPDANVDFIKKHPLMDEAVPALFGQPLILKATFDYRFSVLAVDPQVPLQSGGTVDVLFIATDSGMIIKAINALSSFTMTEIEPVIIEEIHAVDGPIVNLQLAKESNGEGKLIIITDEEVKTIPLHRCHVAKSCSSCVELQDPYCVWYESWGRCQSVHDKLSGPAFQNVTSGTHTQCPHEGDNEVYDYFPTSVQQTTEAPATTFPPVVTAASTCAPCVCPELPKCTSNAKDTNVHGKGPALVYDIEDDVSLSNSIPLGEAIYPVDPSDQKSDNISNEIIPNLSKNQNPGYAFAEAEPNAPIIGASIGRNAYTAETLAIAVTVSCVGALVIGFICGFLISRRCKVDDDHRDDIHYLDTKLAKRDNLSPSIEQNMYFTNNKQINNMVTNFNPKNTNGKQINTTTNSLMLKPVKCAYI
ncbi:unnamed protein product [Meganyctiphanes norvegica]|uniref:Sema domain-containing protein n=1 Tax=Meganyctiphanes norvegica TaxID=48144 RepID=A0AAV2R4Z9_MEGNR